MNEATLSDIKMADDVALQYLSAVSDTADLELYPPECPCTSGTRVLNAFDHAREEPSETSFKELGSIVGMVAER